MADYITKIRTLQGDKQIDYNSLANLPSLPLLCEVTTTEEVRWIDTGDNAFEAKNIIIINLNAVATSTNTSDTAIAFSAYQEGKKPGRPWDNAVLGYPGNGLANTYDKTVRIISFRGDDGYWTSIHTIRNTVNGSPVSTLMTSDIGTNGPIYGLFCGDATNAGEEVFGVGTTLKVWGY